MTLGEVPEWSNGAVSKTVERVNVPRVRIPVSPPALLKPAKVGLSGGGAEVVDELFSTTIGLPRRYGAHSASIPVSLPFSGQLLKLNYIY